MVDNLLEMAESHLGSSGIGALGSALGLPEGKGQAALHTGLATVLAGMLNKGSSKTGLAGLLKMVTGSSNMDLSSMANVLGDPEKSQNLKKSGGEMVENIFGSNAGGATKALSSELGVSGDTGGNLLKVAAPVAMSLLGKQVVGKGLGAGGLASLLMGQKSFIKDKLPAGLLQQLGAPSFDKLGANLETHGHEEPQVARVPEKKRGGFGKWLWPLLIALAALYALNMCVRKDRMEEKPSEVIMEKESVTTGEAPETRPRDTTMEEATDGNFASSFREYLGNSARDPNREFLLGVPFAVDSATVTSRSIPDVDALAKTLKEHPGATIAIEGHTSSDGDEAKNQQLSEERAEAVRQMLVDKGIDGNRITATGMGSAKPIADDSTENGKEKNRRISVRVVTFQ